MRQDPRTRRFHLSWRLLALAFGHAHRVGIAAICFPILQALADAPDELVQLAVTPRTITARRKLVGELREVRRRGYAIVDEELAEGGRAVGAAIMSAGRAVGGGAVSGPTFRLSIERLYGIAPGVTRAAAELGALWPLQVTARDFGLGVRPQNGHGRRTARGTT